MKNLVISKPSLLEQLRNYSDLSGQSMQSAVDEALEDWLSTTAEARLEVLAERCGQA